MKTGTNPKTLRIPNDTIADIEREASAKDTTFSDIAINRLRHKDNALTPQILSKLQTVLNKFLEGARTGSVETIKEAQKEANELWKKISM